jgi:hypothetical protein
LSRLDPLIEPFFLILPSLDNAEPLPHYWREMAQKRTKKPRNGANRPGNAEVIPFDTPIRVISVDENGLRDILLKLRSGENYIADLAAKLGVSAQMLGEVLSGKKGFGPKLLSGLGVVRTYQMYDVGPKWIEFNDE